MGLLIEYFIVLSVVENECVEKRDLKKWETNTC